MIKIYSIREIVEATNNILHRPTKKKNSTIKTKTETDIEPQVKKDIPYLLKDSIEIQEVNKMKIDKTKNLNLIRNTKNKFKINSQKDNQFFDNIYMQLNKKIKKNSLKLIFDQQGEINKLNNKIKDLKQLNQTILSEQNTLKLKINELKNLKDFLILENNSLNVKLENIITKQMKSENHIEELKKEKLKLEKQIDKLQTQNENSKKKIYDISEIENKNKFFQEENLRIGSELLEVKKKYDILKKEIEKNEIQKSNLISKINSVNEALSDTNILTNVFENKVQNKVNIIDHNKIETEISKNLDEKIKTIFLNKD